MSVGHLAMAFDVSIFIALVLLVTGCGPLKGNTSSQAGMCWETQILGCMVRVS
jgi:dipeptide/tripeptide permease